MSDTLGSIIKECDPPKIQADVSVGGEGENDGYVQGKADRIVSRVNKWNSKNRK